MVLFSSEMGVNNIYIVGHGILKNESHIVLILPSTITTFLCFLHGFGYQSRIDRRNKSQRYTATHC